MGPFTSHKTEMVTADRALPGREEPMHQRDLEATPGGHYGLVGSGVACLVGLPGASAE